MNSAITKSVEKNDLRGFRAVLFRMVPTTSCNDFHLTYPQTHSIIEESSIEMGEETCYTNIQRFSHDWEGYQISFPDFGRGIRADSLPLTMTKASVFLSHIIKGYGDKPLSEPTAVSSVPNEEELVVLIQTELD